jgi:hypothetical protein
LKSEEEKMDVISLVIYLGELALAGILLWYVIAWLPSMPERIKLVCQALVALIFLLAAIGALVHGGQTSTAITRPLGPGPGSPNLGR